MITPVWGEAYIDRWLGFSFASLRSHGNIPYLNERYNFELIIITKAADAEYMRSNSNFLMIMRGIPVRFILMDEFFPKFSKTSYGVPLALAYAKAILELGSTAIGTYVILMNADIALASESLKGVADKIDAGYDIIAAQAIRAIDGPARAELIGWTNKADGILAIDPRSLMAIINRNLHSTITARIVNEPHIADSTYYHQIFWRVSDDCLAMRGFLIHPLCFRIQRMMEKVVCPVDYGFITELCPNGRFCALDDSDDYLMIELQERNSESHLLHITRHDQSMQSRVARLEREIIASASGWTTAEHRRSATRTMLYHEKDLPSDIAQRIAPFEAFVERILTRMPPPTSHVGHFHWLSAVGTYRKEMAKDGRDSVALLDDSRNAEPPRSVAVHRSVAPQMSREQPLPHRSAREPISSRETVRRVLPKRLRKIARVLWREVLGWQLRFALGKICAAKSGTIDFVYVGKIIDLAPPPRGGLRATYVDDFDQQAAASDCSIRIPFNTRSPAGSLVIFADAGLMATWDCVQEDMDRYFSSGWRQVVLVLITGGFRPLDFAHHTYLLSTFLNSFPHRKYENRLDVLIASHGFVLRSSRGLNRGEHASLDKFSVLLIAVQPRPEPAD
jgi:hypothetical protein